MRSPIDDTKWASTYGSYQAVRAAFDRVAARYHEAIWSSGAPQGAVALWGPPLAEAAAAHPPEGSRPFQGIDLGCGSGVLGSALIEQGYSFETDGIDISPGMLHLAGESRAYRQLMEANLNDVATVPALPTPYDFVITLGLVGDYLPYYSILPWITSKLLRPGGWLGLAVESSSTPSFALMQTLSDLHFTVYAETELPVPDAGLMPQIYYCCLAKLGES